MLSFLRIENFAIIEFLELELGPGLTVLSGETGAGKSIILAAVDLLLGQRAAADLIRAGASEAVVEALFHLDPQGEPARILAEAGLEQGDPSQVVIRRVVSRQGRNRVQINGSLATLGLLSGLGSELVSVCGQHEQQSLLRSDDQLLLLDAFAGQGQRRQQVAAAVAKVRQLDGELAALAESLAQRQARREVLEHTKAELEAAALDAQEEAALKQERSLLANAEKLAQLAAEAHQGLYGREGAILESLAAIRGMLGELAGLDPGAAELSGRVEEAYFLLEDAANELRDYGSRLDFSPGRLDRVEERLHQINRLARKYGGDVAAALDALAEAKAELSGLEDGSQRLAELDKRRGAALAEALNLAGELGQARRQAADRLSRAVEKDLSSLGMAACRLKVELTAPSTGIDTPRGKLSARGLEQANFLIAPNPGEGFRPLARIASGGELSRLLLTLRSLVARRHGAPTLVFDEVDAGVGGDVGSVVGQKLAALAFSGQVICITHLPQIAVWGQRQLAVRKQTRAGRTATVLQPLQDSSRVEELARMLAGEGGRATARRHAEQLLAAATQARRLFKAPRAGLGEAT